MSDDIVTRLREYSPATCSPCDTWGKCGYGEPCDCTCHVHPCREAADEIERLRKLMSDYVSLWYQMETTTNGASNDLSKAYYAAFHAIAKAVCGD